MADELTLKRGPVGRRFFLRGAGGLAVFGGAFVLVGCGDDDGETTATTVPVATTAATMAATTAATAAATAAPSATTGAAKLVLYERLGGAPAIQAVIDDFLMNVAADDRINTFFANADLPRLNMMLVNQIGEATGGPEKYTGGDMKTVHTGMEITMDDFNALVEDLVKSLDKFSVPATEKNELLGALAPMSADIVTA